MSNFKPRILVEVRRKIADDSSTYICWALEDIASNDHRRSVHVACLELKADVMRRIAPHRTVGDWLHGAQSSDDVKMARLAILDDMLAISAISTTV